MEAAAGITGLILFVGKIAKEAASFFDGWSEAPTDVRLILRNFQHLQGFLEDLDDALKTSIRLDTPLAVNEEAKFRAIMDDCNETFAQMEKLMKTYHDVSSNLRTRTIWLAYGQDEYAKIGRSIESHKTTFMMRLALIR